MGSVKKFFLQESSLLNQEGEGKGEVICQDGSQRNAAMPDFIDQIDMGESSEVSNIDGESSAPSVVSDNHPVNAKNTSVSQSEISDDSQWKPVHSRDRLCIIWGCCHQSIYAHETE
jgi:hypothetical protein